MIRDIKKSKQIAGGILIILSLFVSSVAACICSHHTEKAQVDVSCHEHSEKKQDQDADSSEKIQQLDSYDECGCVLPAPRAISKSETIKFEKQTSALPVSQVEIKIVSLSFAVENSYFEKPSYLSDSFYNLKSPRAPPVL